MRLEKYNYEQYHNEQNHYGDRNEYEEDKLPKAGCLAIGFSFVFPIVGIIIYFVQRKKVENPSAYWIAAVCGWALGLVLQIMARLITGAYTIPNT